MMQYFQSLERRQLFAAVQPLQFEPPILQWDNVNGPTTILAVAGPLDGAQFDADPQLERLVQARVNASGAVGIALQELNPDGTWAQPIFLNDNLPGLGEVADINGDGVMDVVTKQSAELRVFLNDGAGHFASAPIVSPTIPNTQGLLLGDFNEDGHVDVLVKDPSATATQPRLAIQFGDGAGHFAAPVRFFVSGSGNFFPSVMDRNGDGHLDILVGTGVLLGNGDGTFSPPVPLSQNFTYIRADINGDGKPDQLNYETIDGTPTVGIRLGDGAGHFGAFQPLLSGATGFWLFDVKDFNGDKLPDILWSYPAGDFSGYNDFVLLNQGSNTFAPPQEIAGIFDTGFLGTAGRYVDVNNDGLLDHIYGNFAQDDSFFTTYVRLGHRATPLEMFQRFLDSHWSAALSAGQVQKGITHQLQKQLDAALAALKANDTAAATDALNSFIKFANQHVKKSPQLTALVAELTDLLAKI
ncbi:MAG TPA: VCBS repeat-containing protein [Tepidisphaeraceae bacterium]|jgi:hypothetical protein